MKFELSNNTNQSINQSVTDRYLTFIMAATGVIMIMASLFI